MPSQKERIEEAAKRRMEMAIRRNPAITRMMGSPEFLAGGRQVGPLVSCPVKDVGSVIPGEYSGRLHLPCTSDQCKLVVPPWSDGDEAALVIFKPRNVVEMTCDMWMESKGRDGERALWRAWTGQCSNCKTIYVAAK